jgi:hypothetical protein
MAGAPPFAAAEIAAAGVQADMAAQLVSAAALIAYATQLQGEMGLSAAVADPASRTHPVEAAMASDEKTISSFCAFSFSYVRSHPLAPTRLRQEGLALLLLSLETARRLQADWMPAASRLSWLNTTIARSAGSSRMFRLKGLQP